MSIVDEGASSYIMSSIVWEKLDSQELVLLAITFLSFRYRPLHRQGISPNLPVYIDGKMNLIDG